MAPAPSACITASDSFFLFTFNMEPPMESLDIYNSLGRYPQIRTAMATGTARSYGLFRCTGNTGDRLFCREIDRSLFWKRLDITTMTKRAATKCCACYTGRHKTVANLPTMRSSEPPKHPAKSSRTGATRARFFPLIDESGPAQSALLHCTRHRFTRNSRASFNKPQSSQSCTAV
jgi:hypothetical protein